MEAALFRVSTTWGEIFHHLENFRIESRVVNLDVEVRYEELLRQLSYDIKNQRGASKDPLGLLGALDATSWFFMA